MTDSQKMAPPPTLLPGDGLPVEVCRQMIKARMDDWRQGQYVAGLDYRVAQKLGDDQMRNAAIQATKRAEQALEVLSGELAALDPPKPPEELPDPGS